MLRLSRKNLQGKRLITSVKSQKPSRTYKPKKIFTTSFTRYSENRRSRTASFCGLMLVSFGKKAALLRYSLSDHMQYCHGQDHRPFE